MTTISESLFTIHKFEQTGWRGVEFILKSDVDELILKLKALEEENKRLMQDQEHIAQLVMNF